MPVAFDLRKGLQNWLLSMPDCLANTVFEGQRFNPTKDVAYQTVQILTQDPENPTFGSNFWREKGMMRVRLYYPDGQGPGPIILQAEKIRNRFPRGLTITEGGAEVHIQRTPSISTGVVVGDRYVVTVDIKYFVSVFA